MRSLFVSSAVALMVAGSTAAAQTPTPGSSTASSQAPAPSGQAQPSNVTPPTINASLLGPINATGTTRAYVAAEAVGQPVVFIGSDATPYGIMGTFSNHPLGFRTNNIGRLFIDTSGNVGIGIANPGQKLSVAGVVESTFGGFKFPDGSIQTSALPSGGSYIQNTTSQQASANFNIAGSGIIGASLGVGVGAAEAPLHVASASPNATSILLDNTSNGLLRRMYLSTYGSAGGDAYWAGLGSANTSSLFAPGLFVLRSLNGLVFSGSSQFEHMRITPTGRVVVGPDPSSDSRVAVNDFTSTMAIFAKASGQGSTGTLSEGVLVGVLGQSPAGNGVKGYSASGTGVWAESSSGKGVVALTYGSAAIDAVNQSTSGFADGVRASTSSGDAVGLWARNFAAGGTAGRFDGNVAVYGTLTKSGGSFKIDHPLDPANQYLSHSFVESPDMMNIYNGIVTTDADGTAEVTLPLWFQALNEEFRYQLTCIGTFAQAIVAEEIRDNRFVIKTSVPRVKVSWQVTGIRHDPWAQQHRIPVEETKPDHERGFYMHPDAYGQPAERGISAARSSQTADPMAPNASGVDSHGAPSRPVQGIIGGPKVNKQ